MSECQWILIDSTKLFIALFAVFFFFGYYTPHSRVSLWYKLWWCAWARARSLACLCRKCNLPVKSPEKNTRKRYTCVIDPLAGHMKCATELWLMAIDWIKLAHTQCVVCIIILLFSLSPAHAWRPKKSGLDRHRAEGEWLLKQQAAAAPRLGKQKLDEEKIKTKPK